MRASAAQRIDQLEAEVSVLRQTVELLAAGDADPLLTVQAAALLCGRNAETIRLWCVQRKRGFHDPELKRHRIPRSDLIAFLIENFGAENLPFPLRAFFGSDQTTAMYPAGHGTRNREATTSTARAATRRRRGTF